MKKFIITVDTEGDNLWEWKPGDNITGENARYIERFQTLCEKYRYKPVYLVNCEMAQSDILVDTLKERAENGLCEIGMHLHAWNTPPEYSLPNNYDGCPYITEYPEDVIRKKHEYLYRLIVDRFGIAPVSYRAGRWATNECLFKVLDELGFLVDCSITPQIKHKSVGMSVSCGNDYRNEKYRIKRLGKNLIEVPMTTVLARNFNGVNIKNRLSHFIKGEELWLRPAVCSYEEMIKTIKSVERYNEGFLELMIHSSELMPGCNPYCKTEEDIEKMYRKTEQIFRYVSGSYEGSTLREYYHEIKEDI